MHNNMQVPLSQNIFIHRLALSEEVHRRSTATEDTAAPLLLVTCLPKEEQIATCKGVLLEVLLCECPSCEVPSSHPMGMRAMFLA